MKEVVKSLIVQENLIASGDTVLLAVSGGIDSMVMTHILIDLKIKLGIAHCNFQLRDQESDQDHEFVREQAQEYGVPFFEKRFNTAEYAIEKGISIQMAARELRYAWFEEIRKQNDYASIAVATHANDEVETVLINLIRGTGIAGLHGIFPKQGNIIRPLLSISRNDIIKYAKSKNIAYREDKSNADAKYIRNKIRHKIIPVIEEVNPSFLTVFKKNIENFRNTENIYRQAINSKKKQLIIAKNGAWHIEISALQQLGPLQPYLFEILAPFNFTNSVVEDIIDQLDGESGKIFLSNTHKLVKDRTELIIKKLSADKDQSIFIHRNETSISEPISLVFSDYSMKEYALKNTTHIAAFDVEKLQFPLELRRWKNGDVFQPMGMKGKKKISDFLIDNKVPLTQKENTFVLISAGKIIWVVGMRAAETTKITAQTENVFEITFCN